MAESEIRENTIIRKNAGRQKPMKLAVAPGIIWQRVTPSLKASASSQRFFSAAILRM